MATPLTVPREETSPPALRRPRSGLRILIFLLAAAALAGAAYRYGLFTEAGVKGAMKSVGVGEHAATKSQHDAPTPLTPQESGPWDGLVAVTPDEQKAIGFNYARVQTQDKPMRIELTGRTAYDDQTITKIRPRFDARVEKVLASIGAKIKKGDPLVEIYSTDLAKAKSDFQNKYVQWQHDRNLYNLRETLVATGAISQQLWVDTKNDEQKSRLDYSLAKDYLAVFYEVPAAEVDPLLQHLGEKVTDARNFGSVTDKAKMTLRAKASGYIISRTVVPGNYYESTDTLMEIAPLDHLHVWANVYELDQDKVRVGQGMEIQFPYLAKTIQGHVDYVSPEVSKDTRAVKIRAVIPNPDARLKSDMLVKAMLEIPPVPGQTVIPRQAMVAISGEEFAYVRVPRDRGAPAGKGEADRFERLKIDIAQENADWVVVSSGLKPGQEVVTNGSLILAQLYEDQRVTSTGQPGR